MTTDLGEAAPAYPGDAWHTFYGRRVWPLGESGDEGAMVEGHDRRAHAALSQYLRTEDVDREIGGDAMPRRVRRFHTDCGCTSEQHAEHDQDGRGVCEGCARWGLPPCEPELFSWSPEWATEDDADGLPVLYVHWG